MHSLIQNPSLGEGKDITAETEPKLGESIGYHCVKKTLLLLFLMSIGASGTEFSFRNTDFSCLLYTVKYFKTSMMGLCYTCGRAHHYPIDYFVSLSFW